MFGKAARFREPKPSDIPGPGTYAPVDIDEIFSGHLKRGAFLEKADRFDPDKISDTPGICFTFPMFILAKSNEISLNSFRSKCLCFFST